MRRLHLTSGGAILNLDFCVATFKGENRPCGRRVQGVLTKPRAAVHQKAFISLQGVRSVRGDPRLSLSLSLFFVLKWPSFMPLLKEMFSSFPLSSATGGEALWYDKL